MHVVTGANLRQKPILVQNSSRKFSFLLPCGNAKQFYSGVDKAGYSSHSCTFMKQTNKKKRVLLFQMFTIKLWY